jgi:hypothetical protein
MMNRAILTECVDRLASVLTRHHALQDELLATLREKLDAMRRADIEAMTAAARRERQVLSRINDVEVERFAAVGRLADALGAPSFQDGRGAVLRNLAGRLEAATRDRLLGLAAALREKMLRVGEAQQVVELVSRELLTHFKTLFSIMTQPAEHEPTYSSGGERGRAAQAGICLDAVG